MSIPADLPSSELDAWEWIAMLGRLSQEVIDHDFGADVLMGLMLASQSTYDHSPLGWLEGPPEL